MIQKRATFAIKLLNECITVQWDKNMQTYVLNWDTVPEIIDSGPLCIGIPTKIHKEFCYRLHIWKNWTKTFKNAIDKMKWRPQKALFSTCQLFWSEFCQRSKAIYFLRSEQTVSAFYISIQNMDRNLFEKRTSICLFISILFKYFISLEYFPFQK